MVSPQAVVQCVYVYTLCHCFQRGPAARPPKKSGRKAPLLMKLYQQYYFHGRIQDCKMGGGGSKLDGYAAIIQGSVKPVRILAAWSQ